MAVLNLGYKNCIASKVQYAVSSVVQTKSVKECNTHYTLWRKSILASLETRLLYSKERIRLYKYQIKTISSKNAASI